MTGYLKLPGKKYDWVDSYSSRIIFNDKKREILCRVDVKKPIGNPVREVFTIRYEDYIGMTINGEVYGVKRGNALDFLGFVASTFDPRETNSSLTVAANITPEKRYVYGESFTITYLDNGEIVSKEIWFKEDHFKAAFYDYIKGTYTEMQQWIENHLREMGVERPTIKPKENPISEKKTKTEMDTVKALREYKKLLDDGIITEEQFNHKRDELMS